MAHVSGRVITGEDDEEDSVTTPSASTAAAAAASGKVVSGEADEDIRLPAAQAAATPTEVSAATSVAPSVTTGVAPSPAIVPLNGSSGQAKPISDGLRILAKRAKRARETVSRVQRVQLGTTETSFSHINKSVENTLHTAQTISVDLRLANTTLHHLAERMKVSTSTLRFVK